jgi:hypothetical protein
VEVAVRHIDHLVTAGNHSTTITLAFAEAIRDAGEASLRTCFFMLMPDYVMADGSLRNAFAHMRQGARAVQAGNFQVLRRRALPWLEEHVTAVQGPAAIPARTLVRFGLEHLHPATVANIVTLPYDHNIHTNRLFWRVDDATLLGRFYLAHPLCVRPEVTDFKIGASFDYSFIPEMCPSGRTVTLTDSDEYLVVEVQPGGHESNMLVFGPLVPRVLARSLSEWTTRAHRDNVAHRMVFHARDAPAELDAVVVESDRLVDQIGRRLRRRPRPHRGHRYWVGAIGAYYELRGRRLPSGALDYVHGVPVGLRRLTWWYRGGRYVLLGRPPDVYPWDPDWPDHRLVIDEIESLLRDTDGEVLLVSDQPTLYTTWADGERVRRMRCAALLQGLEDLPAGTPGTAGGCLLEVTDLEARHTAELVDRVARRVKPGGRIVVVPRVGHDNVTHLVGLDRPGVAMVRIVFVPDFLGRRLAARGVGILYRSVREVPVAGLVAGVLLAAPVLLLSSLANLLSLVRARRRRPSTLASSFIAVLERTDGAPPCA